MARTAWGLGPAGFEYAWDSWQDGTGDGRHDKDKNEPPAPGAPVFWDLTTKKGIRAGHVAIADNDPEYCWSIDFVEEGKIDRVAIAEINKSSWFNRGGGYVGWSTTLNGTALPIPVGPKPPDPTPDDGMLRLGAKGDEVRRLQEALIAHGVIKDTPANHDGDFGPGMDKAVRRFQQEHNLVVNGVVGPETWAALA